ncbi:hypothetical protein F2Q68_00044663 [Brassica cretica]|uniref:Uncharacterized protein n=1 Tax=Brassica cretica TaxID=69181 RepID=A0A8S9LKT0_BRACR|nr:hypothetical protein F2Q68_00044663 [Brassica cretica]
MVHRAIVGDFDFWRISREWAEEIVSLGSSPMTSELRGLIGVLRRGRPRWLSFTSDRIWATYALPPSCARAPIVQLAALINSRPASRRIASQSLCGNRDSHC